MIIWELKDGSFGGYTGPELVVFQSKQEALDWAERTGNEIVFEEPDRAKLVQSV